MGLYGKDTTRPDRYRAFSYPNYLDISEGVTTFWSIAAQDFAMAGDCEAVFSYPMFRDLERVQQVFTGIAAHRIFGANLGSLTHVRGLPGVAAVITR